MSWFEFEFLDKRRKDEYLPLLFDILYENMRNIVPTGTYDGEKTAFLAQVGPALEKEPRRIILMYAGNELAGYFQYYVNDGRFMVEEIQIAPEYQCTNLLLALFRFLGGALPEGIETVAAYAHEQNVRSRAIMERLGMKQTGENEDDFCYYTGDFGILSARF